MKIFKDLMLIVHKLKSNSKLNKNEKTKAFSQLLFMLSGIFEICLAVSNISTIEISTMDYKILSINLFVFVVLMIILISMD